MRPLWLVPIAMTLLLAPHPASAQDDAAPDHPLRLGASTLEATGSLLLESWNKNLASEILMGGTVGRGRAWKDGLLAMLEIAVFRVAQEEARDAVFFGLSGGLRWRVWERPGTAAFVEFGVGVSSASARVPARGSYFNYVALGGAGATRRLRERWHGVIALRVLHLSNGGLYGNDRNPDVEAIGGYVGLLKVL